VTIDPLLIQQAAASAAGMQRFPEGALYMLGTPIGNLADLSLRAVYTLSIADAVACEDTRVTSGLLRHFGLHKRLISLHEHNEEEAAQQIVTRLGAGERVVYVSDAGTPAVSDPGARLVDAVRAAGHAVIPLPGPSSTVAALSVAGDPIAEGFRFRGFLAAKGAEREAALRELADSRDSTVLFEAPHRIESLAAALTAALGASAQQRRVTVCRELTKQFESVVTMPAAQLSDWFAADANRLRGEFVLVVHAAPPRAAVAGALDDSAERLLTLLIEALPVKQAVAIAAKATGAPRNALYERAVALKRATGEDDDETA
jgi:16S rRNA (cytidine1402-2'-O)-methyltransferase